MSYTDVVGDIVRITSVAIYPNGQIEEMTLHLSCLAAGGADSRTAIAGWMDSLIQARLLGFLSDQVTYYGSKVSLVKATVKWAPVVTRPNVPGTSPDQPLPSQVRALIEWGTGLSGAQGRGRNYVYTPTTLQVDTGGILLASYATALLGYANAVLPGYTGGPASWQPVIVHRPIPPATLVTASAITGVKVNTKYATQRRSGALGRINTVPW